jgi:hypothetical protein
VDDEIVYVWFRWRPVHCLGVKDVMKADFHITTSNFSFAEKRRNFHPYQKVNVTVVDNDGQRLSLSSASRVPSSST